MKRIASLFAIISTFCMLSNSQESRIELHTITSTALGIDKQFYVYLPEDYDASSDHYPTVYLFRGHESEWVDSLIGVPIGDLSRQGNIKTVADSLYRMGQIGKMILIMPGLSSNSFTNFVEAGPVNMINVPAGIDGLGTGQFEDYMVDELIPYVDTNFRTIPSRWSRGADGFSFGGFCSFVLAARHPELISSVGSYDGVAMWLDFDDPAFPGPLDDGLLGWEWFHPNFGNPRNIPYMKQHNFSNIVKYASPPILEQLLPLQYLITTGPFNHSRWVHFVGLLAEKGMKNSFDPIRLYPSAVHNWFWADYHMYQTLPLHWRRFQNPRRQLDVNLLSPPNGSKISGTVQIGWSRGTQTDSVTTLLSYSKDGGRSWNTLLNTSTEDSTFSWNTLNVPDGARYLVMVTLLGDSAYGLAYDSVTVDNPGNGLPDVALIAPGEFDSLSGVREIRWLAVDAEDNALSIALETSVDFGATWQPLVSNLFNTGSYSWDTRLFGNSDNYWLKLICSDGTGSTDTVWGKFVLYNPHKEVPNQMFEHVSGIGGGTIALRCVENASLAHAYRLTFDDTSSQMKTYDVFDLTLDSLVVENGTPLDGKSEGPAFGGVRLIIKDYPTAVVESDSTRWIAGTTDLGHNVILPEIQIGVDIIKGVPYPADYEVRVSSTVADTSSDFLGASPTPMKFTVWNVTENRQVDVVYVDTDNDNGISPLDAVYILEDSSNGQPYLTWEIFFSGDAGGVLPGAGAIFRLKTLKPFTNKDVFEFTPVAVSVSHGNGSIPTEFGLSQNYPNPFNPTTETRSRHRLTGPP